MDDPSHAETYYWLAASEAARQEQGDVQKALDHYGRAITLAKDSSQLNIFLRDGLAAAMKAGNLDKPRDWAHALQEKHPLEAALVLGTVLEQENKPSDAHKVYSDALEHYKTTEARVTRGRLLTARANCVLNLKERWDEESKQAKPQSIQDADEAAGLASDKEDKARALAVGAFFRIRLFEDRDKADQAADNFEQARQGLQEALNLAPQFTTAWNWAEQYAKLLAKWIIDNPADKDKYQQEALKAADRAYDNAPSSVDKDRIGRLKKRINES
jgi:tetratricopeptide (TPR) repeat protein